MLWSPYVPSTCNWTSVADTMLIQINGKWVAWIHTIFAYAAFFSALVVGIALHYHKIVQNEHYGYPDEWFPSVSATIGEIGRAHV